jgi:hypothetical protein
MELKNAPIKGPSGLARTLDGRGLQPTIASNRRRPLTVLPTCSLHLSSLARAGGRVGARRAVPLPFILRRPELIGTPQDDIHREFF